MATGPSPALLEDPRFDDAITTAAQRQGLTPEFEESIRQLVGGSADPSSFGCCNSGCRPCSKDFLRAAEEVLNILAEPPAKPAWWQRLLGRDKR